MKCLLCNQVETLPGKTSILLERGHVSLTITDVPARVCPYCGEAYAEEEVVLNILRVAEMMARAGTKVAVCAYEAMGD